MVGDYIVDMAICIKCDDEYSDRRLALGYRTCLDCGQEAAEREILFKAKCTAPAYNKGGYMYVSSASMAKDLGR